MTGVFGIFNPLSKWKKGDLPGTIAVTIVLDEYSTINNGHIALSALLATDEEIDWAVNMLIKDLESARKSAKRVLKNQREKIHSSFKKQ